MRPDFSRLYSQLDIRPDCSLDEFKHACRRRIAELHPDRDRSGGADERPRPHRTGQAHAELALDDLLELYAKALVFHRRHGRLPGAVPRSAFLAGNHMQPTGPARTGVGSEADAEEPGQPQRGPLFTVVAIMLLLVAIGAWKGGNQSPAQPPAALPESQASRISTAVAVAVAEPLLLELGMDPASVRTIQGEPMQVRGDVWEYGPSWLMFERRRLVDWHSSPLHPLKTGTVVPPEQPEQPEQR